MQSIIVLIPGGETLGRGKGTLCKSTASYE